jgi:hypothetical protein
MVFRPEDRDRSRALSVGALAIKLARGWENRERLHLHMTYSFCRNFWGRGLCPGIAVDLVQCFPANCLYGDRNGLQLAV